MEKTLNQNFTKKSSVLTNDWKAENDRISLVLENMRQEVRVKSNPLGISWYFFVPTLAMTCVLLMPQVRGYFISAGWRWALVMLLSFGISFSLNPMFSKIAFKLNMLDHPNQRKLHHEATPVLGGLLFS